MKSRKYRYFILGFVLLAGAIYFVLNQLSIRHGPQVSEVTYEGINVNQIEHASSFDDLFQQVREVKLSGKLLRDIRHLVLMPDGQFLVNDGEVSIFDTSGRFKQSIGKRGRKGPGEYLSATTVEVDDSSNIYILDDRSILVSAFDKSGNYKYSFRIDKLFQQMALIGNRLYTYSTDIYFKKMATCYEIPGGKKLFEFAPSTEFLKELSSNGYMSISGIRGPLIVRSKGVIYIAHPYEYLAREFDENGREIRDVLMKSNNFVSINSHVKFKLDLSKPTSETFKSYLTRIWVWKNFIFVIFRNEPLSRGFLDIYDVKGNKVTEGSLEIPKMISDGFVFPSAMDENGNLWVAVQGEMKSATEVPNPSLFRYRFLPLVGK